MGQAKRKMKETIRLPEIAISETHKMTVLSLIELLTLERQQADQRVLARRGALNGFVQDLMEQMKVPKGYAFDGEKLAFVDAESLKAAGAKPI